VRQQRSHVSCLALHLGGRFSGKVKDAPRSPLGARACVRERAREREKESAGGESARGEQGAFFLFVQFTGWRAMKSKARACGCQGLSVKNVLFGVLRRARSWARCPAAHVGSAPNSKAVGDKAPSVSRNAKLNRSALTARHRNAGSYAQ
jgi:hypothetical protein